LLRLFEHGDPWLKYPTDPTPHRAECALALRHREQEPVHSSCRHRIHLQCARLLRHLGEPRAPSTGQPKLIQNLVLGDLLVPPEDVDLAEIREPELVQVHLRAEGDEADERMLRQERDGLAHGHLDVLQLLFDDACVDDEEKDGGRRGRLCGRPWDAGAADDVLDGGALREEFGGDVGLGDGGVVGREVVPGEAQRADPDLSGEVDAREGVEERGAGRLAAERRVGEWRWGRGVQGAARRHGGGERDDAAAGLDLGARPGVPGEADSVGAVGIGRGGGRRRGGVGRHGLAAGQTDRSRRRWLCSACACLGDCLVSSARVAWSVSFSRSRSFLGFLSLCCVSVFRVDADVFLLSYLRVYE
jgi:hypothetical protein